MSAPYQAISPDFLASVKRLRSDASLDVDAAAFARGTAETMPARAREPNRHQRRSRSQLERRRPQRSPEKQGSYERRHRLAFSGPLPPALAARFTVGQMACLRIVGDEHRFRGYCVLSLDEIGARAGVARKTAQRAMWAARDEKLLTIEERRPKGRVKHLPNLVKITSVEWLVWLARGAKKQTGHLSPTTVNTVVDDDDTQKTEKDEQAETPKSGHPSKEAVEFATELASIAGHRLTSLPQSWVEADPAQVVQTWINALVGVGAQPQNPLTTLRSVAVGVMRRKPDLKPPHSPRYFGSTVRTVVNELARSRAMVLASRRMAA